MAGLNLVDLARVLIDLDSTTGREKASVRDAVAWMAAHWFRMNASRFSLQPLDKSL